MNESKDSFLPAVTTDVARLAGELGDLFATSCADFSARDLIYRRVADAFCASDDQLVPGATVLCVSPDPFGGPIPVVFRRAATEIEAVEAWQKERSAIYEVALQPLPDVLNTKKSAKLHKRLAAQMYATLRIDQGAQDFINRTVNSVSNSVDERVRRATLNATNLVDHSANRLQAAFEVAADRLGQEFGSLNETIFGIKDTLLGICGQLATTVIDRLVHVVVSFIAIWQMPTAYTRALSIAQLITGLGISHVSSLAKDVATAVGFLLAHLPKSKNPTDMTDLGVEGLHAQAFDTSHSEKDLVCQENIFMSTVRVFANLFNFTEISWGPIHEYRAKRLRDVFGTLTVVGRFAEFATKYLEMMFHYIYESVTGRPWDDSYKEFTSEVFAYIAKIDKIYETNKRANFGFDLELNKKALALIDEGKILTQRAIQMRVPPTVVREIDAAITRLRREQEKIGEQAKCFRERIRPEVIWLVGPPGHGKSIAAQFFASACIGLSGIQLSEGSTIDDHIHNYVANADFFDGYRNQVVCLMDEVAQERTQEFRTKMFVQFCKLVNDVPYALNMASVEDKGCTFFTSKFIIATSNAADPAEWAAVQDKNALYRRIHHMFFVTHDDYDKNVGHVITKNGQVSLGGYVFRRCQPGKFTQNGLPCGMGPAMRFDQALIEIRNALLATKEFSMATRETQKAIWQAAMPKCAAQLLPHVRTMRQLVDDNDDPNAPDPPGTTYADAPTGSDVIWESEEEAKDVEDARYFPALRTNRPQPKMRAQMLHLPMRAQMKQEEQDALLQKLASAINHTLEKQSTGETLAKVKGLFDDPVVEPYPITQTIPFEEDLAFVPLTRLKALVDELKLKFSIMWDWLCQKAQEFATWVKENPIRALACAAPLLIAVVSAVYYAMRPDSPELEAQGQWSAAAPGRNPRRTIIHSKMPGMKAQLNSVADPQALAWLESHGDKNIVFVTTATANGSQRVYGVAIGGRKILIVKHALEVAYHKSNQNGFFAITIEDATGNYTYPSNEVKFYQDTDRNEDVALMELPITHREYPDITSAFITDNDIHKIDEAWLFIKGRPGKTNDLRPAEKLTVAKTNVSYDTSVKELCPDGQERLRPFTECYLATHLEYNAQTQDGDCTSIIVAFNPKLQHKIIGFHTAREMKRTHAVGALITQEKLKALVKPIIYDRLTAQGLQLDTSELPLTPRKFIECGVHIPRQSEIIRGPLYGLYGGSYTQPANLKAPIEVALKRTQAFTLRPQRDMRIWKMAVEWTKQSVPAMPAKYTKVLTDLESINGWGGSYCSKPMNLDTSMGFYAEQEMPWSTKYKHGKTEAYPFNSTTGLHEPTPQVRAATERLLFNIKNYHTCDPKPRAHWMFLFKDELRKPEKVDIPRGICPSSAEFVELTRRYFHPMCCFLQENHRVWNEKGGLWSSVGINPHSAKEWTGVYRRVFKPGNGIIGADIKNADGTQDIVDLYGVKEVVMHMFRDADPEDNIIRSNLLDTGFHSTGVVGHSLIDYDGYNNSGGPLTIQINTFTVMNWTHYAYIDRYIQYHGFDPTYETFCSEVTGPVNGDDDLLGVNKQTASFFNQQSLAESLAAIGVTVVDSAKKGSVDKWADPNTVQFLKRGFIEDNCGMVRAPLEQQVIKDMPQWVKRGQNKQQVSRDMVTAALHEWFHHGRQAFDMHEKILNDKLREQEWDPVHLTYGDLYGGWVRADTGKVDRFAALGLGYTHADAHQYMAQANAIDDVPVNLLDAEGDGPNFQAYKQQLRNMGADSAIDNIRQQLILNAAKQGVSVEVLAKRFVDAHAATTTPPLGGISFQTRLMERARAFDVPGIFSTVLAHQSTAGEKIALLISVFFGMFVGGIVGTAVNCLAFLNTELEHNYHRIALLFLDSDDVREVWHQMWNGPPRWFVRILAPIFGAMVPFLGLRWYEQIVMHVFFYVFLLSCALAGLSAIKFIDAIDNPRPRVYRAQSGSERRRFRRYIAQVGDSLGDHASTATSDASTVVNPSSTTTNVESATVTAGVQSTPAMQMDPYGLNEAVNLMSREQKLASFTYANTNVYGDTLYSGTFPGDMWNVSERLTAQLDNYSFMRAKAIELSFRVQTTNFHSGHFIVAGSPAVPTSDGVFSSISAMCFRPFAIFSVRRGATLLYRIPWNYRDEWIDLNAGLTTAPFVHALGSVVVKAVTPLQLTTSDSSSTVTVEVWGKFIEPELAAPCYNPSPPSKSWRYRAQAKSEAAKKSESGVLSGFFERASELGSVVSAVPIPGISAFAAAGSGIAGLISRGLKVFGLSKPTSVAATVPTWNSDQHDGAGHGLFTAGTVSLSPETHLAEDMSATGEPEDLMHFDAWTKQPALIKTTSFSDSTSIGTILMSFAVTPMFGLRTGGEPDGSLYQVAVTPAMFAASYARYGQWDMDYLVVVDASEFLSCRLRASWHADNAPIPSSVTSQFGEMVSVVWDVKGSMRIPFKIPWNHSRAFLPTGLPFGDASYVANSDPHRVSCHANGVVLISLDAVVVGPGTAVNTDISITVYAACGRFIAARPKVSSLQMTVFGPGKRDARVPKPRMHAQAGEAESGAITGDLPFVFRTGEFPPMVAARVATDMNIHQSEIFDNFRDLFHRFTEWGQTCIYTNNTTDTFDGQATFVDTPFYSLGTPSYGFRAPSVPFFLSAFNWFRGSYYWRFIAERVQSTTGVAALNTNGYHSLSIMPTDLPFISGNTNPGIYAADLHGSTSASYHVSNTLTHQSTHFNQHRLRPANVNSVYNETFEDQNAVCYRFTGTVNTPGTQSNNVQVTVWVKIALGDDFRVVGRCYPGDFVTCDSAGNSQYRNQSFPPLNTNQLDFTGIFQNPNVTFSSKTERIPRLIMGRPQSDEDTVYV